MEPPRWRERWGGGGWERQRRGCRPAAVLDEQTADAAGGEGDHDGGGDRRGDEGVKGGGADGDQCGGRRHGGRQTGGRAGGRADGGRDVRKREDDGTAFVGEQRSGRGVVQPKALV